MSQGLQHQEQPQALSRTVADTDALLGFDINELKQPPQVETRPMPFFDRLLARLRRFDKIPARPVDQSWHDVIWREWRHTTDEDYAEHLFRLVADAPVGAIAILMSGLTGIIYGSIIGMLLTLIGSLVEPVISSQIMVNIVIGAGLGSIIGLLIGFVRKRHTSWRTWLAHLTLNLDPIELGLLGSVLLAGGITWLVSLVAGFGHVAGIIILGILLLTGLGAKVMVWLLGLDRAAKTVYSYQYRAGWFWWRDRPNRAELETALKQACIVSFEARLIWWRVLVNLEQQRQPPGPPEQLIEDLRSVDWVERFIATQLLITLGGAAVPHLQAVASQRASILRRKAIDLLRQIERETTAQLADQAMNLLCPRCLRRCGPHSVAVTWNMTINYYGCRMCGQSHVLWPGQVVAVLDADMPGDFERADPFRVNWLTRHFLFDFDEVEIIRATDEEVERFVVQVGNDTDPVRTGRYQHMPCRIGPDCHLSENTIRVLGSVFGTVVQM